MTFSDNTTTINDHILWANFLEIQSVQDVSEKSNMVFRAVLLVCFISNCPKNYNVYPTCHTISKEEPHSNYKN